jgi:hypothetical protein
MKPMALTTIIFSLILIFMVYISFSKNLSMTTKFISLLLIGIVSVFLILNLQLFKNSSTLVKNKQSAQEPRVIQSSDIPNTSGEYSISTWIYIDDWNYKFGNKKSILQRGVGVNSKNLNIYLDEYNNDIITEFNVAQSQAENPNTHVEAEQYCIDNSLNTITVDASTCIQNEETGRFELDTSTIQCKEGEYHCSDGTKTSFKCSSEKNIYTTELKGVPIQKWFNVTYAFGNKHVDTYLNGKLTNTKTFDGVQFQGANNNYYICSEGGFSGYISNFQYFDKLIDATGAWDIYKDGFNPVMVDSLLGRYKTSVVFYENDNEKAKYYVV